MDALAPDAQTGPMLHDVTILRTKKLARASVLGVPPEEFGVERNARDIPNCNYCFHDIVTKTRADLIQEGYDEEDVNKLPEYLGLTTAEEMARDSVWEHASGGTSSTNNAAQVVKITEHYVRMDYEGDGKPRLYQVVTGGDNGELLKRDGKPAVEEFDAIPFAGGTPIPQTHRFFGRSIADVMIEIQNEKTALKRGALDNLYLHNAPRPVVSEALAGPNTIDDLLTVRSGAPIRVKSDPANAIQWQEAPDITGSIYPMMQYLDAEIEMRTGVSRQSQGIDANALQNQSATAVAQVFSASQMRMKLIARILAEGVKDIFALLHATIRKHGQEAQTVRLRNQWITVDPRNWKTREDMTIHVGLGTGGKAQQFAQQMAILNAQKELIMGQKGHMVPDDRLFNSLSDLTKIAGYKNPDRYFADPTEKNPDGSLKYPPAQPAPDPKVQAAQVKAQTDQAANAQKAQLEQQKAQNDAIHQQVKTQAEIELAKIKADLDAKIAVLEAHLKMAQQHQEMAHREREHQLNVAETHMDMVATAHTHDTKMEQGEQTHKAKLQQMKQKPKGKT